MSTFWIIPGIALTTLIGWLIARLLEGHTAVLYRWERWILGVVLGLTFTMFVTFLVHTTFAMPLNRTGYLFIQLAIVILLGIVFGIRKPESGIRVPLPKSNINRIPNSEFRIPIPLKIVIIAFSIWTSIKILSTGVTFLLLTPPFQGDTVDNWNLRGKMFFVDQAITLTIPNSEGIPLTGDVNSYPPTVPLVKASFSTLAGNWSEPLVNVIHLLWYLSALALLFFSLRRVVGTLWALGGTYILASLPLYLMHGTNPYADVYLSVHILAAVTLLFHALASEDPDRRASFLRLSAFATALLPFTKNEALIMHTPAILLILAIALWWMKRIGKMSLKDCIHTVLWYVLLLSAVTIPWIAYKWSHGLTFGNAQSLSNINLAWQPGVLKAIAKNTFLEGNWLLLFPLLLLLLIIQKRTAFKTPLLVLTGFFLIVYLGQFPLYMFTFLSTEALYQTGYARGIVQLAPTVVMIVTVLLFHCLQTERGKG
ncbi:MAG: hypothetical protein ABIA92_00365 [Patescibacteria group bacterium]